MLCIFVLVSFLTLLFEKLLKGCRSLFDTIDMICSSRTLSTASASHPSTRVSSSWRGRAHQTRLASPSERVQRSGFLSFVCPIICHYYYFQNGTRSECVRLPTGRKSVMYVQYKVGERCEMALHWRWRRWNPASERGRRQDSPGVV